MDWRSPPVVSVWLPGRRDPFRANGAWDCNRSGSPVALRPDYFQQVDGRSVSLERDYMVPFFNRVAEGVRSARADFLIFAEVDPFGAMRGEGFPQGCPERTVNASHWYDLAALVTKRFDPSRSIDVLSGATREGPAAIELGYVEGLSKLKKIGDALNGGAPTLIGECGVPYDMNDADAYAKWAGGDRRPEIWTAQTTAIDLMYNALDRLLLSSTQWNYSASNRNDPMVGDGWNQEDLSIWSSDQIVDPTDPNSGGRAVEGFCRPFARAVQGEMVRQSFDRASGTVELSFDADPAVQHATEIFVPTLQYPAGFTVTQTPDGVVEIVGQRVLLSPRSGRTEIRIVRSTR
jgi:hypothetical protein